MSTIEPPELCRASGIPEEVHDQLTGHSSGSRVGRTYGHNPDNVQALARAIKRLRVPVNPFDPLA